MMTVEFERAFFGDDVVASESLGDEWRLRAFMVLSTLLAGALVVARLVSVVGWSPLRWLLIGASAAGTWHYADNIAWPAKHREPRWLYSALLFAPMDQTWMFQFVMHAMTVKVADLLTAKRAARPASSTLRLLVALIGAAHMITLGHFLVDGMGAYTVDAWLSIVIESALGAAAIVWAVRQQR